jgi:hypothetical protein
MRGLLNSNKICVCECLLGAGCLQRAALFSLLIYMRVSYGYNQPSSLQQTADRILGAMDSGLHICARSVNGLLLHTIGSMVIYLQHLFRYSIIFLNHNLINLRLH